MKANKTCMDKELITPAFDLHISNGISRYTYHKNLVVNEALARQMAEARLSLSGSATLPNLVDARKGAYITSSARKFMAGNKAYKQVSAVAILIDHHVMKILFNTLLNIKTCLTPARIFTSEEKALEWLAGFKEIETKQSGRRTPLLLF